MHRLCHNSLQLNTTFVHTWPSSPAIVHIFGLISSNTRLQHYLHYTHGHHPHPGSVSKIWSRFPRTAALPISALSKLPHSTQPVFHLVFVLPLWFSCSFVLPLRAAPTSLILPKYTTTTPHLKHQQQHRKLQQHICKHYSATIFPDLPDLPFFSHLNFYHQATAMTSSPTNTYIYTTLELLYTSLHSILIFSTVQPSTTPETAFPAFLCSTNVLFSNIRTCNTHHSCAPHSIPVHYFPQSECIFF